MIMAELNTKKTIFCDIDGTILSHAGSLSAILLTDQEILPGVKKKFTEWEGQGYNIILVTGRKESMRKYTEKQLQQWGIFYDQLIMGLGGGTRYLINDDKPDGTPTCYAYSIERDKGLVNIGV
jgi:ribonucleotide monophosphatase NagD (HAD superfamily)